MTTDLPFFQSIKLNFIQTLEFEFPPSFSENEKFSRDVYPEIWTSSEIVEGASHIHPLILQNGKWEREQGAEKVTEYRGRYSPPNVKFSIEDLKYALQKNRNNMLLQYCRGSNVIPLTEQEVDKIIEALTIKEAEIDEKIEQNRKDREKRAKKAEEDGQKYHQEMNAERAARTEAWDERWGTDGLINKP